VTAFIDGHRDRVTDGLVWGVEPICRVLQVAPSTYYAAKARPPSLRAVRDEDLKVKIRRVWEANFEVYGTRKVWLELRRQGEQVARCTVERLMRDMGLSGAVRGATAPRTTVADDATEQPADLVNREFAADRPNRLWVADLTYCRTWSGMCYVAFIVDAFSRFIVGWQASTSLRTDLALDALEQAIWSRNQQRGGDTDRLVHHSDRGVQYLAIRYTDRLVDAGIEASVGSVGDSYDNALAETIIGLYKTELVRNRGPWRGIDDLELGTLEWVDWFNHRRLLGPIGDVPPAEYETTHYSQLGQLTLPGTQ
jgi:putative transposase